MNLPLPHSDPVWEPPHDDPSAPPEDYRQVWHGRMRIVRSRRRMRVLRRRGVHMMDLRRVDAFGLTPHCWAWFVELNNPTQTVRKALRDAMRPFVGRCFDASLREEMYAAVIAALDAVFSA